MLTTVTPYGLQRGTTVTLTLEGANIANTDQVVFDVPGLTARGGDEVLNRLTEVEQRLRTDNVYWSGASPRRPG